MRRRVKYDASRACLLFRAAYVDTRGVAEISRSDAGLF